MDSVNGRSPENLSSDKEVSFISRNIHALVWGSALALCVLVEFCGDEKARNAALTVLNNSDLAEVSN